MLIDIEASTQSLDDEASTIKQMKYIYETILKRFPSSSQLQLWMAQFFYFVNRNDMLTSNANHACEAADPLLDEAFSCYYLKQRYDEELNGDEKQDNIMFYVRYHEVIITIFLLLLNTNYLIVWNNKNLINILSITL